MQKQYAGFGGRFCMLTRPEKEALITIVIVIFVLGLLLAGFVFLFLDLGVVSFTDDVPDGAKVSFEGIVESAKPTSTGGHLLMTVSGVTVFVENAGSELIFMTGDRVKLTGTAATYGGKREISVSRVSDISILT
ncbi:MAG TPA: hypothetical protein O0X70_00840 [Methanocorpusculum sp.]|nr:hypothetical protein [Methanocorpusculum sp.]